MSLDSTLDSLTSVSIFQTIQQTMPHWFQQGGVVMWLLLLASFLSTIVTLDRIFIWLHYHFKKERFPLRDCFAALNQQQKAEALKFCQQLDTPALNMLAHGIKALPFSPNEKMEAYAEKQIGKMSQGQTLLDTIITLAPMLGILGTVLGIIDSFHILSLQGVENPTAVVGGIAQALISTAMGLVVALLALLPYNLFRSLIRRLTLHIEGIGAEFYHICHQKSLITNQNSEIVRMQQASLDEKKEIAPQNATVAEHSEMPYHYEFKKDSDEINVSLHSEMSNIDKPSQASLLDMYTEHIDTPQKTEQQDKPVVEKSL